MIAGSSPRGRGTLSLHSSLRAPLRFIPARAGNTIHVDGTGNPNTVHPRAGGEHSDTPAEDEFLFGSSPRGRGTLEDFDRDPVWDRFIPARAGNTPSKELAARSIAVHPRAGGEHCGGGAPARRAAGSSPRGRGTHPPAQQHRCLIRFIPARAGNTFTGIDGVELGPVHPRAGGEHVRIDAPRNPFGRFIPARAGNTHAAPIHRTPPPVHPRAGGEHWLLFGGHTQGIGSSPRGRGTHAAVG